MVSRVLRGDWRWTDGEVQGVPKAAFGAVKDEGKFPPSSVAQETDGLQQDLRGITAKALLNQPIVKQVIKVQRESKAQLPILTVSAIDEWLVDRVVDGEMPLCVVELSSFLLLVYTLNDRYTVPSSYKLRKSIFGRVNESTQVLEKLISSSRFVTLTIDGG